MFFNRDSQAPSFFDVRSMVDIHVLPEGTQRLNFLSRLLFSRGEKAYDYLWRYVKKVDRSIYKGQGAQVRIGDYYMGMRAPNRVPCYADFRQELLFVGRQLTIPFGSIRGLLAGHGLLPWRKIPVFVVMVKVDGCDKYLPIHQCLLDLTVVDLADFLSSHMHAPLGVASNPLHFCIPPGSPTMTHAFGSTPLYELRGMITSRGPDGCTRIKLLCGDTPLTIVNYPDPLGWIEDWGIVVDNLISIVARRTRSRFGHHNGVMETK